MLFSLSHFSVLYISVHRSDNGYYYPYGGDAFVNRVGVGPGEGFSVNLAWNGVSCLFTVFCWSWHKVALSFKVDRCITKCSHSDLKYLPPQSEGENSFLIEKGFIQLQSNFNGLNIFGTIEIYSRYG